MLQLLTIIIKITNFVSALAAISSINPVVVLPIILVAIIVLLHVAVICVLKNKHKLLLKIVCIAGSVAEVIGLANSFLDL